jgi:hypothetical protein
MRAAVEILLVEDNPEDAELTLRAEAVEFFSTNNGPVPISNGPTSWEPTATS